VATQGGVLYEKAKEGARESASFGADVSACPSAVDVPGVFNPAESPARLLRLSPEEREVGSSEFLGEGFANAEDNGPSNRDGKQKACSDKRA
jgi:hypothetical protein